MKKVLFLLLAISTFVLAFVGLVNLNKSASEEDLEVGLLPAKSISEEIRKAAVAGSFYTSNNEALEEEIDGLLAKSKEASLPGKTRVLIVPHAGLQYSGGIAAAGFAQLHEKDYERVILLGSSHTANFKYIAVDDQKYWETPLGKVEVDEGLVDTLANGTSIRIDRGVHESEHSLEMELIFLQRVLTDFKIVPIVTGQLDKEHIGLLAQKLAYNFDDETLLVVSSDLSHYPNYETANAVDNQLINSILTGRRDVFDEKISEVKNKGYQNLATSACGQDAIRVALEISNLLAIDKFEKIEYGNSGDFTDNKDRVVGYASISGYSEKLASYLPRLDDTAQREALEIAREALESYLSAGKMPDVKPRSDVLNQPLGVFVTLMKNGNLRGCIGEFEPVRPLYEVIQDTAISGATKDRRFAPVLYNELQDIEIELSVMTPRKKLDSWQQIRLGRDGVVIQKSTKAGTFLPQVARDNNWGLEEFLGHLCSQKAGLPTECYRDDNVNIFSFEVLDFKE
jgi:AmmeMemoRadiSam system protein B/AmmeMemoRadiSam system protein A